MAAVTLLSLGNGAPDVFSSLAALRAGQYRTGFGAILSAGTFVSALVVGFVAIYAAPFAVDPAPFVRDVLFYLTAAFFLFYVYLTAEIFLWQAVGFVGFYFFFVGLVFYMDFGMADRTEKSSSADLEGQNELGSDVKVSGSREGQKRASGLRGAIRLVSKAWELPVSTLLRLTIPQPAPSQWSRFYASANIALCPLALLYACNSFMSFNHPIVFLLPNTHFPLWSVVLMTSFSLAFLHFVMEKEPPKTEHVPVVVMAFVMSVFWISTTAGELVNCLEAIGTASQIAASTPGSYGAGMGKFSGRSCC
ncbi:Cation/calcium exchanger 5 [Spatholobus suberectus]|nr:Cation/calcium exchanger 5 [Spatholobus suberectus]